jgi:hypothetical protein
MLDVPAFERAVLALLDGEHDREALARALGERVRAGTLPAAGADSPGALLRRCEEALDWLAQNALLGR